MLPQAHPPVWPALLGRFAWRNSPLDRASENFGVSEIAGAGIALLVVIGFVASVSLLTHDRLWRPLSFEWPTSVDYKTIGIAYIVIAFLMLSCALVEAVLMRAQQATAVQHTEFLLSDHFAQLFSTHGSILIFVMAAPFMTVIIKYIMPLQIGERDMAFTWANSVALWFTGGGAMLMMASLVFGRFSTGGWSGYPRYMGPAFSPGVGPDYRVWAVTLGSIGSTGAIAFVVWPVAVFGGNFTVIPALALVQVIVQFRCFLHNSLARSARDDLLLVLFAALIVTWMVPGTLFITHHLIMRMM